jgi:hypothetical protein
MHKILFISLLITVKTISIAFSQSPNWRFVKETRGIKVYFRDMPNSGLNEVKIQTTFEAKLSTIVEALIDVDAYPKWAYKVDYSKIIKQIAANEVIYYNKIDFPWPMSNRDIAVHTKVSQNTNTKEVTSVSFAASETAPLLANFIRIKEFNSKWSFIPKDGKVAAEYVFSTNPGGNIPHWLINFSLDEGPIKAIQNFKKMLGEKKYISQNTNNILN